MGAPNRTPHPSPLQLLAIMQAKADGMYDRIIAKRTGHSDASARRWFDAWSHDAKTLDNWVREYRIDMTGHRFDDYYPVERMPVPTPKDFLPGGVYAPRLFNTALGRK